VSPLYWERKIAGFPFPKKREIPIIAPEVCGAFRLEDPMSQKSLFMLAMVLGSTIGGYVPSLLGADSLSMTSLFGSVTGGVLGIWLVYRFLN
jgi:hypothetical protein